MIKLPLLGDSVINNCISTGKSMLSLFCIRGDTPRRYPKLQLTTSSKHELFYQRGLVFAVSNIYLHVHKGIRIISRYLKVIMIQFLCLSCFNSKRNSSQVKTINYFDTSKTFSTIKLLKTITHKKPTICILKTFTGKCKTNTPC